MNHLIDFGVCALLGCTNYIILHIFLKDILSAFGCSNLMLHSKSPLLGERRKEKYSPAKELNGKEGLKLY